VQAFPFKGFCVTLDLLRCPIAFFTWALKQISSANPIRRIGQPRGSAVSLNSFRIWRRRSLPAFSHVKNAIGHLNKSKVNAKAFKWESLHVKYLMGKLDARRYANEGSRFRPENPSVNWP